MTKTNIKTKFSGIEIELNRLRSEKAALQFAEKRQNNRNRKTRTRTLIQMGGLLELTPLPSICGIELGNDLQLEHKKKAAVLLGILAKYTESLPDTLSDAEIREFETYGNLLLAKKKS